MGGAVSNQGIILNGTTHMTCSNYATSLGTNNTLQSDEDWTISLWNKASTASGYAIIMMNQSAYYSVQSSDAYSSGDFGVRLNYSYYSIKTSRTLNVWHHFAIINSTKLGKVTLYLDGKSVDSAGNHDLVVPNSIGNASNKTIYRGDAGIIDDFCLIKGQALWTENFTPPTRLLSLPKYNLYITNNNNVYGMK